MPIPFGEGVGRKDFKEGGEIEFTDSGRNPFLSMLFGGGLIDLGDGNALGFDIFCGLRVVNFGVVCR